MVRRAFFVHLVRRFITIRRRPAMVRRAFWVHLAVQLQFAGAVWEDLEATWVNVENSRQPHWVTPLELNWDIVESFEG